MTTVIKASGSAEFLGMVPALAGYTPTQSLVVAPFTGSRCYGVLRVDLPDDPSPAFADGIAGLTHRVHGTDAVAVVVYCDQLPEPTRDGLVLPEVILVDLVLDACHADGLRIVDALCVTPNGWSSYLDDDPVLHPLSGIRGDVVPVDALPRAGDQTAGVELPDVGLVERERVGRAWADLSAVMAGALPGDGVPQERAHPEAIAAALLFDDVPALFESALAITGTPPPFLSAALLWLLDRPVFRDVAIAQWARDEQVGATTLEEQIDHHISGRLPSEGTARTMMGEGHRPDADRLADALRTVRLLASLAPRAQRVGPLAVAAWLCWALGRATQAAHHLQQALQIAPDYSFGRLLDTLMDARPLPDWAFDRRDDAAA